MTKAITLIGMSGVGKTWLSLQLQKAGWQIISADYLIGKELESHLTSPVEIDNLQPLANFLGFYGQGDNSDDFFDRQRLYQKAELTVMNRISEQIQWMKKPCVIDTSGSFCELDDAPLYQAMGRQTHFVYLRADEEMEAELLRRAVQLPKPLFYPSGFLEKAIKEYESTDTQESFFEYVFPKLFQSRLPKYQKLADNFGEVINAKDIVFLAHRLITSRGQNMSLVS